MRTDEKQLLKFIENNSDDCIQDYFDKVYENYKDINRKLEKHMFFLILLVFFYVILSSIDSISIGPVTLKDIKIFEKVIPIVFASLLFNFNAIMSHERELKYALKLISEKKFLNSEVTKNLYTSFVTRTYIPYTLLVTDLSKNFKGKRSILTDVVLVLLFLPYIFLSVVPYYVLYKMIENLYVCNCNDFIGKVSLMLTSWLTIATIFFQFWRIKNSAK